MNVPQVPSGLRDIYAATEHPVVFIDESYQLSGRNRYYIMAAAMVDADLIVTSRRALLEYYGGSVLHASAMYQAAELESIRGATRLVAGQTDATDLVVYAPVSASDQHAEVARERCLQYLVGRMFSDFEASTYVIDARPLEAENEADRRSVRDLRRRGDIGRDVTVLHAKPSQEPLLALADVVAWTYRQQHGRNDPTWFEPLREHTHIARLP